MKKLLSVLAVLGVFFANTNLRAEEIPSGSETQEVVLNQEIQDVPVNAVTEEVSVNQDIQQATVNPENKVLVAYFSATGNTKSVAEKLAKAINADLFEIVPTALYTAQDLDWQNKDSRVSFEMSMDGFFPAIASRLEDVSQYKTVFLGFPIWNGSVPAIVKTFLINYDFSGKKIIPFATSGSSDIGNIYESLQSFVPSATVVVGKRFAVDTSDAELKTWADEQMQ